MFFAGLEHGATFIDGFGEGFFDINIFACLASHHGWESVPMIGSGNQHGIDVLAIQDAAKVFNGVRLPAALLLTNLGCFAEHGVIDIANHRAIEFRVEKKTLEVPAPHSATADEAEPNLLAGRRLTGTG